MAAEWHNFTGHLDPSGKWYDEESAYDGSTSTYAEHDEIEDEWSEFLYLTIPILNSVTSIRFNVYYYPTDLRDIDLDIKVNGVWEHIFQGVIGADHNWVQKDFASKDTVNQVRVRFLNTAEYGEIPLVYLVAILGEFVINPWYYYLRNKMRRAC